MTRISIISKLQGFDPELTYVVDFINEHPLKPSEINFSLNDSKADLIIEYGKNKSETNNYYIPSQEIVFNKSIPNFDNLIANQYLVGKQPVYAVENNTKPKAAFCQNRAFAFDLIETIFFHISRYEEYHCDPSKRDQWEMLHEDYHFLVRNNLHQIPVVDHLLKAFYEALGFEVKNRKTQYNLTHDIDVLRKFKNPIRAARSIARSMLDFKNPLVPLRYYIQAIFNKDDDPYNSFEFLFAKTKWNRKIAFVMAGGQSKFDNFYQLNENNFKAMIEIAKKANYEIGLHPSYDSFKNNEMIAEEKKNLENALDKKITVSRQHFLKFDFSKTIEGLEKSGLKYDSTLGYQRLIGFRCGTGFDFRLFDIRNRRQTNIIEIPMIIMDGALLDESSNDLSKAENLLNEFLKTNPENTQVTFNVHNTIFDPTKRDANKMKELYKLILSYAVL